MGGLRDKQEDFSGEADISMTKSTDPLGVSDLSPFVIMAAMRSVPQMGAEPGGISMLTVFLTVSETESLTMELGMRMLVDCFHLLVTLDSLIHELCSWRILQAEELVSMWTGLVLFS